MKWIQAIVMTCLALVASACGDDHDGPMMMAFGAPCRSDFDCGGLYCVKDSGGICLPLCVDDFDCGPGYACQKKDRQGSPGQVRVCKLK